MGKESKKQAEDELTFHPSYNSYIAAIVQMFSAGLRIVLLHSFILYFWRVTTYSEHSKFTQIPPQKHSCQN